MQNKWKNPYFQSEECKDKQQQQQQQQQQQNNNKTKQNIKTKT